MSQSGKYFFLLFLPDWNSVVFIKNLFRLCQNTLGKTVKEEINYSHR